MSYAPDSSRVTVHRGDALRCLPRAERGIRQRDVECPRLQPVHETQGVAAVDRHPVIHSERGDVGPDGVERALGQLHQGRGGRTPADRLEAQRAGTGEEIEHPRPGEPATQNAHPRLPHPLGGGTDPPVRRRAEPPAAEFSGHDPGHDP